MVRISYKLGRFFLFLVILLYLTALGNARRTKDKMYEKITGTSGCFRRLNGTHQVGCTSKRGGSTGVLHYCDSLEDLEFILANGTAGPYIPVLPSKFFYLETVETLKNSGKVSGLILYSVARPDTFSHENHCPNQQFNVPGTCKRNWNPYGTSLLYTDIPFPVFNVEEDVSKIKECFVKFNNFSYDTQNDRSLCSLELKSFMFATKDTPTCRRRSNMEINFHPMKVCDPLGDYNIWASLFPLVDVFEDQTSPKSDNKYVVIVSRLDTTSFFDRSPGANNPITSVVALLSIAKLLKEMVSDNHYNGKKNVLFFMFNGETYDYIGSQRLLYDMEHDGFPLDENNGIFPQIRPENISLFIELSQLSNSKGVFAHYLNENDPAVYNFYTKLMYNSGSQLNFNPIKNSLPPASIHTFIKDYPNLSGLVLSDHEHEYVNKYYNSMYDNATNIDYVYYNTSKENEDVIPKDSIQWHIANVSTMVAKSVYEEIMDKNYTGYAAVDVVLVDELFHCYLEDPNCKVRRAVQKSKIPKSQLYYYVGVDRVSSIMTHLTSLYLSWFTGDVVGKEVNCSTVEKNPAFRYYTFAKSIYDLNVTSCYQSSSNTTEAVSPAFLLDDYDWSSGNYSTWAESIWAEMSVRMFLKPSNAHETMTLIIGTISMVFSFIVVYFINSRSHVLFTSPVSIDPPVNC